MTLLAMENALRVAGEAWATSHGLAFVWDNAVAKDPRAVPTLVWEWRPAAPEQLTDLVVRHRGVVDAAVYVAGGTGMLSADGRGALQLAESLVGEVAGRLFGGGETLTRVTIGAGRRDGTSYVVPVSIPWEFDERRVPLGAVGPQGIPGAVAAYQAFRERWHQKIASAPLSLQTFFDNAPPAGTEPPPWAFASFKLLQPVPLEVDSQRVPGRVIAALNFALGSGVAACAAAADAIARAFHQCTVRGICFGTPEVARIGRTPLNTWQTNVRLPFHYDVRT